MTKKDHKEMLMGLIRKQYADFEEDHQCLKEEYKNRIKPRMEQTAKEIQVQKNFKNLLNVLLTVFSTLAIVLSVVAMLVGDLAWSSVLIGYAILGHVVGEKP